MKGRPFPSPRAYLGAREVQHVAALETEAGCGGEGIQAHHAEAAALAAGGGVLGPQAARLLEAGGALPLAAQPAAIVATTQQASASGSPLAAALEGAANAGGERGNRQKLALLNNPSTVEAHSIDGVLDLPHGHAFPGRKRGRRLAKLADGLLTVAAAGGRRDPPCMRA